MAWIFEIVPVDIQGRIQDLHLGGGGGAQNVMWQHVPYGTELFFSRVRGPWKL